LLRKIGTLSQQKKIVFSTQYRMQSKKMTKDHLFTHAEHQVIFRRREDLKTNEINFTIIETSWELRKDG